VGDDALERGDVVDAAQCPAAIRLLVYFLERVGFSCSPRRIAITIACTDLLRYHAKHGYPPARGNASESDHAVAEVSGSIIESLSCPR